MLPRTARLRNSSDFKRVYSRGMSKAGEHIVVYVLPGEGPESRLGLSVSRKVGAAVTRNKVRRRLSEAFAGASSLVAPGADVVIVARAPAASANYQILEKELRVLLDRAGGGR